MAELIPPLNRHTLSRMTPGEKRVARCLKNILSDECLIWYDIPVGEKRRYPDFIILQPDRGLLFLEVKDWKAHNLKFVSNTTVDLVTPHGIETKTHPLEQARQYAYAVIDMLSGDPALRTTSHPHQGKLCIPYGWGVIFPYISESHIQQLIPDDTRTTLLPSQVILYQDDFTNPIDGTLLQAKLWKILPFQPKNKLTLSQIDRIRWHLFPEIRIDYGNQLDLFAGTTQEDQDDETHPDIMKVLDIQQEQLARSLGEGHRVIHGVSGSGKTLILCYRSLYLAHTTNKPILILCYNVTLAAKLRAFISAKENHHTIQIHHFHEWCDQQLKHYHVDLISSDQPIYERQVASVIEGVEKGKIPKGQYGAICIDEGHDFEASWLKLMVQMVDPMSHSLLLLYDDAQSIYNTSSTLGFTLSSVGIQAQGRTTILRLNYRNTREILQFAYNFVQSYLDKDVSDNEIPLVKPESAGKTGLHPVIHECRTFKEEVGHAAEWIKRWCSRKIPLNDMAILYAAGWQGRLMAERLKALGIPYSWLADKKSKQNYHPGTPNLTLLTLHSSKGLEFPYVIILGIGYLHDDEDQRASNARLLYVGMTRAQKMLVLTTSRNNTFSQELLASSRHDQTDGEI